MVGVAQFEPAAPAPKAVATKLRYTPAGKKRIGDKSPEQEEIFNLFELILILKIFFNFVI